MSERIAEPGPPVHLRHGQHDPAAVTAQEAVGERGDEVVAVPLGRLAAVDQDGRQVGGHGPGGGAEQAGVHRLALAGALGQAQGSEDAQRQRQAGGVVTLGGTGHRRDSSRLGHRVDHERPSEEGGDVVARRRRPAPSCRNR